MVLLSCTTLKSSISCQNNPATEQPLIKPNLINSIEIRLWLYGSQNQMKVWHFVQFILSKRVSPLPSLNTFLRIFKLEGSDGVNDRFLHLLFIAYRYVIWHYFKMVLHP